LSYARYE
jgi:hypothetical protein